jgi:cell division protein FtsB
MGLLRKKNKQRRPRRIVAIPEFDLHRHAGRPSRFAIKPRSLLVIGFAGLMVYLIVLSQMGLWRSWTLWQLRNDLREQRGELTAQVVDLDVRKRLLETDTLYIEKIARTEYHLSHPDEIVYEVKPTPEAKAK